MIMQQKQHKDKILREFRGKASFKVVRQRKIYEVRRSSILNSQINIIIKRKTTSTKIDFIRNMSIEETYSGLGTLPQILEASDYFSLLFKSCKFCLKFKNSCSKFRFCKKETKTLKAMFVTVQMIDREIVFQNMGQQI